MSNKMKGMRHRDVDFEFYKLAYDEENTHDMVIWFKVLENRIRRTGGGRQAQWQFIDITNEGEYWGDIGYHMIRLSLSALPTHRPYNDPFNLTLDTIFALIKEKNILDDLDYIERSRTPLEDMQYKIEKAESQLRDMKDILKTVIKEDDDEDDEDEDD